MATVWANPRTLPPSAASPTPPGVYLTNPVSTPTHAPGIYAAVPYSLTVIVPAEMDRRAVIVPPNVAIESAVQPPPLKLVPR